VAEPRFPAQALAVRAIIEHDRGRWALHLEVAMIPDREDYVVRHRIADYATEREAQVAARWITAAAERDLPHPPLGF